MPGTCTHSASRIRQCSKGPVQHMPLGKSQPAHPVAPCPPGDRMRSEIRGLPSHDQVVLPQESVRGRRALARPAGGDQGAAAGVPGRRGRRAGQLPARGARAEPPAARAHRQPAGCGRLPSPCARALPSDMSRLRTGACAAPAALSAAGVMQQQCRLRVLQCGQAGSLSQLAVSRPKVA